MNTLNKLALLAATAAIAAQGSNDVYYPCTVMPKNEHKSTLSIKDRKKKQKKNKNAGRARAKNRKK